MNHLTVISIIIPSYNTEQTLEETCISVINQEYQNWEAIIVNDGSPDNLEEIALEWVKRDSRFKYFKKENGGLGSARNFGIKKAAGNYILPLDSDNKIRPNFLVDAMLEFNKHPKIDVVYGDALYFGEKKGVWQVGRFDKLKMLKHNYIDACAIIRKSVFSELGYYDSNIPYQGHEDWEFWLRLIAANRKFHYLEKATFEYRVSSNSMINSFSKEMIEENIYYIREKYYRLYYQVFDDLYSENKMLKKNINKSILKKVMKKLKLK